MTLICGIDPGLGGAIATVWNMRPNSVVDMPVSGKRIDAAAVADILRGINPDVVVVEDTQPMPKNGSIASFSLGMSTGVVLGVASALQYPVVRIKPAEWKKMNGLTGKDKDAARHLVREMWPGMQPYLTLKKHVDRADALLIARAYAMKQLHEQIQEANA
jgi:crossover junction endodeoxyribonuclease RuvC